MQSPTKLKTNQDKLKYFYRALELLRLEHNAKGAEVGKTLTLEEFRSWQKNDWEARQKNVLNEINIIKEAEGITKAEVDKDGKEVKTAKQIEFEALKETGSIDTSFDKDIDIKSIKKIGRGLPVVDPIEDFTTYTEDDPLTKITVDSNTVSWDDLKRGADSRVYKDKGVNHFDGDFEHLEDVRLSATTDYGRPIVWRLANAVNNTPFNNAVTLFVVNYGYNNDFEIWEGDGSASYSDVGATSGWALNTTYYLKIKRDEAVGTYGTFYCYVYTNSERTTLQETLSVTLHIKTDFRYLYAFNTYNDGVDFRSTGYSENLDLQEVGAAYYISWTDSISVNDIEKNRFDALIENTDILNLSEYKQAKTSFNKEFSDSFTLSDLAAFGRKVCISVTDAISLSEPVIRLKSVFKKTFTDNISLTDSSVFARMFSVLKTEILNITDSIDKKMTFSKTFTDNIVITEIKRISSSAWSWAIKHTSSWTFKDKSDSPTWTFKTKHK